VHTALRANRGNTGARILDNKTSLESALGESGVPFSILRPAWYLQNLFGAKPWLDQGMFSMPWPADMVWAATDVDDVARAAVALIEAGPTNRAFDIHQPGGVAAAAICRAVQAVTGREIGYQEFAGGTRAAVDGYPISDVHKDLYAELYDYFKSEPFLGEPLAITDAIPGFAYGTLEDFVRRNLYPATGGDASSTDTEEKAMIVMGDQAPGARLRCVEVGVRLLSADGVGRTLRPREPRDGRRERAAHRIRMERRQRRPSVQVESRAWRKDGRGRCDWCTSVRDIRAGRSDRQLIVVRHAAAVLQRRDGEPRTRPAGHRCPGAADVAASSMLVDEDRVSVGVQHYEVRWAGRALVRPVIDG
jgi:hypothetical protein